MNPDTSNNKGITRRYLFRLGGTAIAVAPMLSAASLANAGKQLPQPLPRVLPSDRPSAAGWNAMVDAINEMRETVV